jgi:BTB/POZ domain-containing protein 3/6
VPDVEPDAFLALLKYLYCDEIQLEPDSVLATLYAAKKYIVPHLARECVKYLETSLSGSSDRTYIYIFSIKTQFCF